MHIFRMVRLMVTPRQRDVLAFIATYTAENDSPPTYREIGNATRLTVNAVACKLRALQNKGCLTRAAGRHRAITLTEEGKAACLNY
jgi:repressor LexA